MTWGETKIGPCKREFELYIVGFELPRVKLQWMHDGNPREIDFGSS